MRSTRGTKIILSALAIAAGAVCFSGCQKSGEELKAIFQMENGEIGVFTYENISGGVALTDFEYSRIALEIPGEIDGKPVIGIDSNAFSYDELLSEIYLPDTVKTIGEKAFSGCKKLTDVYSNGDPKSVLLSDTSFEGSNVQSVSARPDTDRSTYFCKAEFKYSEKDGAEGVFITGYNPDITLEIPDEINGSKVTALSENLFLNNVFMDSVKIPDSVTEIERFVFSGCTNLVSVEIPASVSKIGDHAFFNCKSLRNVSVTGGNGLAGGADLSGISKIGEWAFGGCESLPDVTFSDNLNTIEFGAFSRCKGLTDVFIPAGVNSIESCAFLTCSSLESIAVDEANRSFSSSDGVLFNKNQTELLAYPMGKQESYNIPSTVKTLGAYSFYKCPAPVIPKSVNRIKFKALEGTGLTIEESFFVSVE